VKVLVDTSVWSLALRRQARVDASQVGELRVLIEAGRVAMIGPIRQELLSGIRTDDVFKRLRAQLASFPDEPLATADYERAAEAFNDCRGRGIQGSNTDFLICAVAERRQMPIFTTDRDFHRFATILPISLYE
jgi:predicted nucleic acid-binding protein